MNRLAMVDARPGRLFVTSYSITADSAFVQGDWVETEDVECEDAILGSLVCSALAASRTGVPFPDFRYGPSPERLKLLELAGVNSETLYAKGTREVSVETDLGSTLVITPHWNGGRRAGFTEMLDEVIMLDAGAGDAALGAAVRRALEVATDGS